VREGLSHGEKVDLAYKLNMQRRHFDEPGAKRERIDQYFIEHWDGEKDDEEVAETVAASPEYTAERRKVLADGGKISARRKFTTQTEKRKAIRRAIEDDPDASNREIAERTDVRLQPTSNAT